MAVNAYSIPANCGRTYASEIDGGEMSAAAVRNSRPASRIVWSTSWRPSSYTTYPASSRRFTTRRIVSRFSSIFRATPEMESPGSSARMTLSSFSPHTSYILWLHNSVQQTKELLFVWVYWLDLASVFGEVVDVLAKRLH